MKFGDNFAAEWTPDRLASLRPVVEGAVSGDRQAIIDAFQALPEADRLWMAETVSKGAVGLAGGNAYVVPFLSARACQTLVQWGERQAWSENEDEGQAFRMEEVVLGNVDSDQEEWVATLAMWGLAPWLLAIFGKLPDVYRSIQLTRYDAGLRAGGNYHVDRDSKYTAVIALNDDFEGGGTRMVSGVFGSVMVPPVPVGHALVFRGREIFHKGEPVTSGTRKLLTIWTDDIDHQNRCDDPA
jgi:hypothetical protein